jgi:hypothetical protein
LNTESVKKKYNNMESEITIAKAAIDVGKVE